MIINAYAKVNLSLEITGVREDGYHLLDTVMQTVDLYDELQIELRNDGKIVIKCDDDSIAGEDNICYKAAEIFFEEIDKKDGVTIFINKKIPTAAGLGGGSSDAAATLKAMNFLYGNILTTSKLCDLALKLGADVPFFIIGGSARVKGIGEIIESFEPKKNVFLLLIKDGVKHSTAEMYRKIDECNLNLNIDASKACQTALENGDFKMLKESFVNDFNFVCDFENIKQDLLLVGAEAVSLSGSGPTVMGLFENYNNLSNAYNILKEKYPLIFKAQSYVE